MRLYETRQLRRDEQSMTDFEKLTRWVVATLGKHPKLRVNTMVTLAPLAGEAGVRRYFSLIPSHHYSPLCHHITK